MSSAVFPSLPGLTWGVEKTPVFRTKVQTSVNGQEIRTTYGATPTWQFSLSYEFVREGAGFAELQALLGFFLARKGCWDSFLYLVPDDNAVENEQVGVGDGVTTTFQLTRTWAGITEPVSNVNHILDGALMWDEDDGVSMWAGDVEDMWDGGTGYVSADYVVLAGQGRITFNVAPPPGLPVLWSGTYFYRCRFKEDSQAYRHFMHQLWELKKCEMIGSLGAKI